MTRKVQSAGITYPVIVHEGETRGYWVECPAFEGCYSQGKTIEEALRNVREAIELCLADVDREQIPTHAVSLHLVTI